MAYSDMYAHQNYMGAAFGKGRERGRVLQAVYRINKIYKDNSAHFWLERFWPGNYYAPGTKPSLFLRGELSLKIK